MHSGNLDQCLVFATTYPASQPVYLMAGPCDQGSGMLWNFLTESLDGSYTEANRLQYARFMLEETTPLSGQLSWYQSVMEPDFPQCMCVTAFVREGAVPLESDPMIAAGSLGC